MKERTEFTRKEITAKIRALKPRDRFTVYSKSQRTIALQQGKLLKDSGLIEFSITTFGEDDGTFKIIAV